MNEIQVVVLIRLGDQSWGVKEGSLFSDGLSGGISRHSNGCGTFKEEEHVWGQNFILLVAEIRESSESQLASQGPLDVLEGTDEIQQDRLGRPCPGRAPLEWQKRLDSARGGMKLWMLKASKEDDLEGLWDAGS